MYNERSWRLEWRDGVRGGRLPGLKYLHKVVREPLRLLRTPPSTQLSFLVFAISASTNY